MTTVAVLRGGPSKEHEISLQSGAAMLANLDQDKYRVRDIYIDKSGQWHAEGRPTAPERVLRQIDVALLPLAEEYGESGEVQQLLEQFGVRYAGAGPFPVRQARHKAIGKALARQAGLLTPEMRLVNSATEAESVAREVVRSFLQPVIVRPVARSSAAGVVVVAGYAPLTATIRGFFAEGGETVLIEERIRGRGAAVCLVEGLRGEALYTPPAVELTAPAPTVYPYDAQYQKAVQVICPGRFTHVEAEELARVARLMHRTLGLSHCSRSDFIVAPRGVYYLETSASPELGSESTFSRALQAVGVSIHELVEHLLARSLP